MRHAEAVAAVSDPGPIAAAERAGAEASSQAQPMGSLGPRFDRLSVTVEAVCRTVTNGVSLCSGERFTRCYL
ncbi:hypothetical protein MMUR_46870 [Mycolicibacterium murale]|uniref:Uncharacterized protein n=1 Tax=Mycolicibacterium murale TaxID=182220 RepID=A0A7I9WS28_9MYCO|nr:hypothetical protein MMUR_46870 [Mycolicibacterium murale]